MGGCAPDVPYALAGGVNSACGGYCGGGVEWEQHLCHLCISHVIATLQLTHPRTLRAPGA